ncbi:ATP-grasp domain-containing protein [Brevibacillus sp. NPDC058079]|uniref:ATP-grasp domain-containing protein n=1 Tax=Brevibacillus sp. NPDC058079 TaxID=3346330 RepID=UPI0036E60B4C
MIICIYRRLPNMALSFTGRTANFEKWYERLEKYTMPSVYFAVDEQTKRGIIAKTFERICEFDPYFGEMNSNPSLSTPLNLDEILRNLEKRFDHILQGKTFFFRTNLFSPKDVRPDCLVSNGNEALDLLLASQRLYKGYQNLLKTEDLYIVFREAVSFSEEFRCYIEGGQIKAISQYDDSNSVHKGLGASRLFQYAPDQYIDLYRFVDNAIKEVGIKDAVIDVGNTANGFLIIELNPYTEATDLCLFAKENVYKTPFNGTHIRFWEEKQLMKTYVLKEAKIVDILTEEVHERQSVFSTELVLSRLRASLPSNNQNI